MTEKRLDIKIIEDLQQIEVSNMLCEHFASSISLYDEKKNEENYEKIFESIGELKILSRDCFEMFVQLKVSTEKEGLTFILNKDIKLINKKLPQWDDGTIYEKEKFPIIINLSNNFFSSKYIQLNGINSIEKGVIFHLKIVLSMNSKKPFLETVIKNSLKHWVEQFKMNRTFVITGYSTKEKETIKGLLEPINPIKLHTNIQNKNSHNNHANEDKKNETIREKETKKIHKNVVPHPKYNNNKKTTLITDFFKKKELK